MPTMGAIQALHVGESCPVYLGSTANALPFFRRHGQSAWVVDGQPRICLECTFRLPLPGNAVNSRGFSCGSMCNEWCWGLVRGIFRPSGAWGCGDVPQGLAPLALCLCPSGAGILSSRRCLAGCRGIVFAFPWVPVPPSAGPPPVATFVASCRGRELGG